MLRRLEVRDFALIHSLVLEAQEGLSVFTGETGAGKSLLMQALAWIRGDRARAEMLRQGAKRAYVEAVFDFPLKAIPDALRELLALEDDDEPLIISRELDHRGRSLARVNGRSCTLRVLRDLASLVLGIHGQGEEQSLYDPMVHLRWLDRYAGKSIEKDLDAWKQLRLERRVLVQELQALGLDPKARAEQMAEAEACIEAIETANFKPGEREELQEKARILAAFARIRKDLSASLGALRGEGGLGAQNLLYEALEALRYPAEQSRALAKQRTRLSLLSEELGELASDLEDSLEELATDQEAAQRIHERLDLWHQLSRRYGATDEDILERLEEARQSLDRLRQGKERFHEARERLLAMEAEGEAISARLHDARKKAAASLSQAMGKQLDALSMKGARLIVEMEVIQRKEPGYWSEAGRDRPRFLLSANLGEVPKPLHQIASGGEVARVLLALRSLLADAEDLPLLIFDEIDRGISGEAAAAVGLCLQRLAKGRQVFVISHTAQIAALAAHHYLVQKSSEAGRTISVARPITDKDRERELARLLAGKPKDKQALDLAQTMLQASRNRG